MTVLTAPEVAAPLLGRPRISRYALATGAVTGAGLAARLVLLGRQPISRDEAFTAVVTRRSWGGMLGVVRHDSAPPLSYVLDHLATAWSTSPSLLRLPAALAGAAAIPVAAALGRRLGGDGAGIGAAAACAALASLLIPSRDARMYALAATLVMSFALVLWRALERPTRGRLAALAGVTAAAVLTHYLDAVGVMATVAAAALTLRERRALGRAAVAVAAGYVPLAVWIPFAVGQTGHAAEPFWASGLGAAPTLGIVTQLLAGPAADITLPQHTLLVTAQGFSLVGAGIAGVVVLFGLARPSVSGWRGVWYLAVAGIGAIGILALLSLRTPIWDARYASVVWPPCVPLLGLGLARLRWVAIAPVAGMAAAALLTAFLQTRPDVGVAAEALRGRVGPDDVVLATPDTYLQLLIQGDRATVAHTHVPAESVGWFWGVAAYPRDALMPTLPASAATVDVVTAAGDPVQAAPPGHVHAARTCAALVCVDVFRRSG
jgi:mannosyltransferase